MLCMAATSHGEVQSLAFRTKGSQEAGVKGLRPRATASSIDYLPLSIKAVSYLPCVNWLNLTGWF